jgi:hypothetical protein
MVNFFRVSSSASQAKNAARFFYAVRRLAGFGSEEADATVESVGDAETTADVGARPSDVEVDEERRSTEKHPIPSAQLLQAKARLLEKLPAADPSWSAAEYQNICDRFLAMLESLDRSS